MDDKEMVTTKEFVLPEEILLDSKKLNLFQKIATKWRNFSKGIKTLIIIALLLFIIATGILVYAFVIKESKEPNENKNIPKDIVVKENYKYQDGFLIILNESETEIGKYECRNKDEKLCYVATEIADDNFDVPKKIFENGELVIKRSKVYHDRFVFIHDNKISDDGVIILYDLVDKQEIDSVLGVKSYDTSNNYIVLKNKNNEYGLVELKETGITEILDYDYDYMGIILTEANDAIVVKDADKWSIIDYTGKIILKNFDKEIKNLNTKYITVKSKDGYELIDYNKEVLIEKYSYIELLTDYLITVDADELLRVTDYNGVKMNEDGIKLSDKNYNKTYIYKEDGVYKETISAYEYELNGDTLIIKVREDDNLKSYAINLLEGRFSSTLKYYSYLDGKLHFYKDEAKKELIGSYECEYKNNVTATTKELDKCYLANDVNEDNNEMVTSLNIVSITPIINNRFVFIRDALTLATDSSVKINLYDLIQNQVLANYISVNTYGLPDNSIPYHEQNEELIVIGKNKNSKYGAFSVGQSAITPGVAFEYDSLEKLGEYLLAKKSGKWILLNYQGEKISGEFSAQVRSYNKSHVKVLSNKKYYVYNINATIVSEDSYKYVELNDEFYVGIDDVNQLTVYNYEGIPMINDNTIKLKEAQDFNIDVSDGIVILSFLTENGTSVYKYDLATWNRID